ncbi:hypothetical protein [Telluria beijingensis]|uniref:hypothetical protein n=1 Tax=Telluria beijingensis TaxID=3068633 RepID=UPI0027959DFC|nr:hypothetical protein [Massilia sp. REN29]
MPDELRRIGAQMANVMYNLAQRPGDALKPEVVATMDDLRKQWDAAIRAPKAGADGGAMGKDEAIDLLRDALQHYHRLAPKTITAREALRLTAHLAVATEGAQ